MKSWTVEENFPDPKPQSGHVIWSNRKAASWIVFFSSWDDGEYKLVFHASGMMAGYLGLNGHLNSELRELMIEAAVDCWIEWSEWDLYCPYCPGLPECPHCGTTYGEWHAGKRVLREYMKVPAEEGFFKPRPPRP